MTSFLALHRYWIWANRMREHFDKALDKRRIEELGPACFADDLGIFMSYWYGGLFVVIEGWKELGLNDPVIDKLIDSPNTELLRRFRNGAFHFQKDYFDVKFQALWEEIGIVEWVRTLNQKLGAYFLCELRKMIQVQQ